MTDPASQFEKWVEKAEEDKLCIRNNFVASAVPLECTVLTAYAVDARYPDVLAGDVEKIARDAVRMSHVVCAAIRQRLRI